MLRRAVTPRRRPGGVAAVALALMGLASGCLQADKRGVTGALADTAGTGDAAPTDTLIAADAAVDTTAPDASASCPPGGLTVTTGTLADPLVPWHVRVTHPGTIAFSGDTWPIDASDGLQRFRPHADVHAAAVDAPDGATLIDGRDGALLIEYPRPSSDRRMLAYVDEATRAELTSVSERFFAPDRHDPTLHLVTRDRAAFRSCVYDAQGACVTWRLRSWVPGEGQVRTLWEGPGDGVAPPPAPFVDADGVLWAEPADGAWRIRALRGGAVVTLHTVAEPVRELAAHTGGIVWLTASGAWYAKPDREPRRLYSGACGDLDSDGTHAVMLCRSGQSPAPDASWSPYLGAWGELWTYAGGDQLRRVPTTGALILNPRVDRGVVAWLSFPDRASGCFGEATGLVRVAALAGDLTPITVAEVGIGCFCCAAIYPSQAISLSRGLLAWNYAPSESSSPDPPWSGGRLGWAQITSCP
jgi:hypothetical protein